jgi:starch synthase
MFVLFATPECAPFAKTGGLADVAASLPAALLRLGVDVRIVLPFYRVVQDHNLSLRVMIPGLEIPVGPAKFKGNILEGTTGDGVPVYFVECDDFFDRPNLYGNASKDYDDNLERFLFFSHAVLKLAACFPVRPDWIHCNEWQTGLVSALMKEPPFMHMEIRTMFTIHNLGYQGLFPADKFYLTGLPQARFFHPGGMEYWGDFCLVKSGIVYSDLITTVSPTYAKEIQTPKFGKGMDGVLRSRSKSLFGILNGADERVWNPAADPMLPATYTSAALGGKFQCKKSLIRKLGLDASIAHQPLLGVVSRLDVQKGIDLVVSVIKEIVALGAGLVILGTGDESVQNAIHQASRHFPGRVKFEMRFDESLAHRILAGADMLLMPSRYEPCGLTQMYAMKYGTAPIVRAVGGLEDTVISFDPQTGEGNGIKFISSEPDALLEAIQQAVSLYQNKKAWQKLVQNAMQADFNWARSARSYLKLYRSRCEKMDNGVTH